MALRKLGLLKLYRESLMVFARTNIDILVATWEQVAVVGSDFHENVCAFQSNHRTLTIGASITVCLTGFGFDRTSITVAHSILAKQLNPNKINTRSAEQ